MTDRTGSPAPASSSGAFESVKNALDNVLWVIATGSTLIGFVKDAGGVGALLTNIGLFGISCYIGLFPAVLLLLGINWLFENHYRRDITDGAGMVLLGGAVLIAGWLIYQALFPEGWTDDLDAFGRAFFMLVGIATIAAPVLVWLHRKGSTPRAH
ncbi:hypothetical protein EJC51_20510 [Streptomyces aquilus]|uniref:Uncharacterized protein n=1 Tax=Streptomyces aquilus TaxID=2548456 RepID=A0A3Q9C0U3_9ACTN|nr:hypothetical protein [Streptomyces aquilus]AZP18260.1 hypothetical protein EJC51_20510 [Streptomyces aquilus]